MAHNARIPAWRRLGLALKNEDQSGVTVPESTSPHNQSHAVLAYDAQDALPDNSQSTLEPTVSGKPSKLGKRKHQPEPAEEHVQTAKKSKRARDEDTANAPVQGNASVIQSSENVTAVDTVTENSSVPSTDRPKGDPNYRKKKSKPNKRRSDGPEVAQVKATQTQGQLDHEHTSQSALPTLLASTETGQIDLASVATPQKRARISKSDSSNISGSPPPTDRRKSVAFTPDTKTTDGHTGQDMFKKWAAEQKSGGTNFTSSQVSKSNLQPPSSEEVKAQKKPTQPKQKTAVNLANSTSQEEKSSSATTTTPSASKGKKKDPSVYLSYLTQYHKERGSWKFNKAKQNDVVDNALNIFRIPEDYSDALLEYVAGLQGAGVINRLSERCNATLKQLDEQDAQNPISMNDPEARKAVQEDALQERVKKEKKRRKVEGDVEGLLNHPHGEGYIRRLQRSRAEALLTALGRTAPILPAPVQLNAASTMTKGLLPPKRDSRKRKRRGDISSDESSSDSSSESSSDEDSSDSESEDSSDSDGGSSSDSDSDDGSTKSDGKSSSSSDSSDSDNSGNESDSDSD